MTKGQLVHVPHRSFPALVVESDLSRAGAVAEALVDTPFVTPIEWVYGPSGGVALLAAGFVPQLIVLGNPLSEEAGRELVRRLRTSSKFDQAVLVATGSGRSTGKLKQEFWVPLGTPAHQLTLVVRVAIMSSLASGASQASEMTSLHRPGVSRRPSTRGEAEGAYITRRILRRVRSPDWASLFW